MITTPRVMVSVEPLEPLVLDLLDAADQISRDFGWAGQ